MAKKTMTQSPSFTCTFDETGDICHDKVGVVIKSNDTEIWFESGERVVRNLRLGSGDDADQCAFAGIWKPDKCNVGHELKFKLQPAFIAVFALLSKRRSATLI